MEVEVRKARLMVLALTVLAIPKHLDAQAGTSSVAYSTANFGSTTIETAGTSAAMNVGYAKAQPSASTDPTGVAILGLRQNSVLVTETGVPGTTALTSGRTFAEVNGPINTALAIVNPSGAAVVVSFNFTDQAGNDFGQNGFTLDANAHFARFLSEAPFGVTSGFAGTLTFSSSGPIAVTAVRTLINERSQFLMATQPVISIPADISTGPALLAHFADGGGWRTEVILTNTTDSIITGTVEFFGGGTPTVPATPLTLTVNGLSGAAFSYTLRARASTTFETSGPAGTATQTGSIHITPTGGSTVPSAFALFSLFSNGATVTQATVQTQVPGTALRSYVEVNSTGPVPGAIQTAIAIANNSATAATVNLELRALDGSSTGLTASVIVPAFGHIANFVHELFPSLTVSTGLPFRGLLRITSFSSIAVVALRARYNETGTFLIATTPVSNEASTASTADLIFPQIVDGGGYTTQFILFSGITDQNTTGILSFFGQNGQPLNLTVR
jgi:hypothetical protein